ncbi:MAG: DUF692 family protein [Nitrospiraceae bacterium]|nr:DUF692 family protein [Nitrospiraceae bacterium]
MTAASAIHTDFLARLRRVGRHGLGLSVDVYSPDVGGLLEGLHEQGLHPEYLEVFRATSPALRAVRHAMATSPVTYHGEGLWLTQPGATEDALFTQEVIEVASHLQILQSAWMNHECATKHIAGYTVGTYLPPLYTESSAAIVAENAWYVQSLLDRHCPLGKGGSPLVLLELPPLTYFVAGTIPIPTFFRLVSEQTSCGVVLDVGHLWTVYRYSGAWRTATLRQFVDEFLAEFPLDRVIEIHVAGLAVHESGGQTALQSATCGDAALPLWTDGHGAPIPSVLYEMLDQILSDRRLTHLRGLALEVDTKPVAMIVEEFRRFYRRYEHCMAAPEDQSGQLTVSHVGERDPVPQATRDVVIAAYRRYAGVISGSAEPAGPEWTSRTACDEHLDLYRQVYLPYEILQWGGELGTMFPETCRRLAECAIPLSSFLPFWFREPRPLSAAYDFFLLKIDGFLQFVHEEAPQYDALARREAEDLREAYRFASVPVIRAPIGSQ